jgi:uncharacterized protein (DUF488 family)
MQNLFTIGYEGAALDDFIASLKVAGVEILVDIRELPQSRKRGFSKKSLSEALESAGIAYKHVRALGDPKPGREAARRGDMKEFKRIFNQHLSGDLAQSALKDVIGIASDLSSCLLCYERDPDTCHRKIVAKSMAAQSSFKVNHIGVREGIALEGEDQNGTLGRRFKVA